MPKYIKDLDELAAEFDTKGESDPIKASAFMTLGDGVIPQEILNEITGEFEVASFNAEIRPSSPASMTILVNDMTLLVKGQILGSSKIKDNKIVATPTIATSDPTNSRLDLVVVKTDTNKFGEVRHRGDIKSTDVEIIQGTPAASPVVAKSDVQLNKEGKVRIGTITVPAAATSITASEIDNDNDFLLDAESGVAVHAIGGAQHSASTLAALNALISDANVDDSSASRTPSAHSLAGAEHSVDTLVNVNSKISDATLIDTGDVRLSDARTPVSHGASVHDATVEATVNKSAANGYASLDGAGKVPLIELPAAVQQALTLKGTWNASTNTPTLSSGVGTGGDFFVVSVAGSTLLDGVSDWKPNDNVLFDSAQSKWIKIDNTDEVQSVAGKTGAVTLVKADITDFPLVDADHGNLSGGALHALVSGSANGFMSSADFSKLAGIAAGAQSTFAGLSDTAALVVKNYWRTDAAGTALEQVANLNPASNGVGDVGQSGLRWGNGFFANLVTGDLNLKSLDGSAHITFLEKPDGVYFRNHITGELRKVTSTLVVEE